MIGIGYNSKGERLEFDCIHKILYCSWKDLVSIEIPEGVCYVYCSNNKLTELKMTSSIIKIDCRTNLISELDIPKGIKILRCDRNVKGLDKVDWDCDIRLF